MRKGVVTDNYMGGNFFVYFTEKVLLHTVLTLKSKKTRISYK